MSLNTSDATTYTARWLFPVAGPPLERGTITVHGHRIQAVDAQGVRTADVDLGNAAIVPGFVNAHTHLDLSGARGLIPPTDGKHFPDWLRGVIAFRRGRSSGQVQADTRDGLAECMQTGTTLVGDICADGGSWDALAEAPIRAVVFRELIGLSESRAAEAAEAGARWLAERSESATIWAAISPHAPYSVRRSLFAQAGQLVRESKRPLAVHLAESAAELELIESRRGPFVTFLKDLGVWYPDGLIGSIGAVMTACDFRQPKLFIHGNHLAPTARVPRNSTIVYCPRTHAAFGHPRHPFPAFLARGVRVCLGTDSLASNPDLDLLAEARYVHRQHPNLPGEVLLKMITQFGAEALGWDAETGTLEVGKSADLVVVPLPDREVNDPHRLLFAEHAGERRTLFRGVWRSR